MARCRAECIHWHGQVLDLKHTSCQLPATQGRAKVVQFRQFWHEEVIVMGYGVSRAKREAHAPT